MEDDKMLSSSRLERYCASRPVLPWQHTLPEGPAPDPLTRRSPSPYKTAALL